MNLGMVQAERYDLLLRTAMQELADNPATAPLVENLPNVRSRIVRWKHTKRGHRIFFETTPAGVLVLRILHSSMLWPEHAEEPQ